VRELKFGVASLIIITALHLAADWLIEKKVPESWRSGAASAQAWCGCTVPNAKHHLM
jgi:hypothetical protein